MNAFIVQRIVKIAVFVYGVKNYKLLNLKCCNYDTRI